MGFSVKIVRVVQALAAVAVVAFSYNAGGQTLVQRIGSTGSGDGEFLGVDGISVDSAGRIYVVDRGNGRVQVFAPDGSFLFAFGSPGIGDGQFGGAACGVLADSELGRIYVSEGLPGFVPHRVQIFDFEGTFISAFGTQGSAPGQFDVPCQMAMGPSGLHVLDIGNSRVQVFEPDGSYIREIGMRGTGPGALNRPGGMGVDARGRIFIADAFSNNVEVYNPFGTFLFEFGGSGTRPGELDRPCHLSINGLVYLVDALNQRVQVFDLDGIFRQAFPSENIGASRFCTIVPRGLATDARGRIYVEENNSIAVYTIDRDEDGLLDIWETDGLDLDNNGVIDANDLDLPAMGADPDHADLFLELDYETGEVPSRPGIRAMIRAFDAAPRLNPDGSTGIHLWVDTGAAVDPGAREDAVEGTCLDGIDNGGGDGIDGSDTDCYFNPGFLRDGVVIQYLNYLETSVEDPGPGNCANGLDDDGDGFVDGDDPACLVGHDLGGGNVVSGPVDCLGSSFYTLRRDNFDPKRALVFRYGIRADFAGSDCLGGGLSELGGNDFVVYNEGADSIMHELGHTLLLDHGGDDANACKPNYVSLMSYRYKGISRRGGGIVLDFSPPRVSVDGATRGLAPIDLVENALDERAPLDAGDPVNRFTFVNGRGDAVTTQINGDVDGDGTFDGINWNGDDDPPFELALQQVNIDTRSDEEASRGGVGVLGVCANTTDSDELTGFHDWDNIVLNFRRFGDDPDRSLTPFDGVEPTDVESGTSIAFLQKTDLSITAETAGVVEIGEVLPYLLVGANGGPNPATMVRVETTVASPYVIDDSSGRCESTAPTAVACIEGEIVAGGQSENLIRIDTSNTCVDGVPSGLRATARIENVTPGAPADIAPVDNELVFVTTPVDTTPPSIEGLTASPNVLWPPDNTLVPVEVAVAAEDLCDTTPVCTIVSVTSDEPAGNKAPDWIITGDTSVQLRAERLGMLDGREYGIEVECRDRAGNSQSGLVVVEVPHDVSE